MPRAKENFQENRNNVSTGHFQDFDTNAIQDHNIAIVIKNDISFEENLLSSCSCWNIYEQQSKKEIE